METVYVLLPCHNRREVTRRIVECLASQTHPKVVVVLLDDGSTDGTSEMVLGRIPAAVVLRGDGNWWWAGALQVGYEWIRARLPGSEDVVLIANDDTEFEPGFIAHGVELLRERPRTILVAQAYDRATGELRDAGRHVDWRRLTFDPATTPEELNCLSTRGLFMRALEFVETGGFRPRMLPHYASDYEFTIRAHRRGWRLETVPSLKLTFDATTTGLHQVPMERFWTFLKLYFSRRSPGNPVTRSVFVALACPFRWKLRHITIIWAGAVLTVARVALGRGSRY
jgi:GT2 family glycosyltransferase